MRGTTTVCRRARTAAGWLTCGASVMRDGQVALRDRDRGDAHVAAHDDDAGALVDHDLGGEVGLDPQLLDLGQQRDHVAVESCGQRELHGRRIERLGGRGRR